MWFTKHTGIFEWSERDLLNLMIYLYRRDGYLRSLFWIEYKSVHKTNSIIHCQVEKQARKCQFVERSLPSESQKKKTWKNSVLKSTKKKKSHLNFGAKIQIFLFTYTNNYSPLLGGSNFGFPASNRFFPGQEYLPPATWKINVYPF